MSTLAGCQFSAGRLTAEMNASRVFASSSCYQIPTNLRRSIAASGPASPLPSSHPLLSPHRGYRRVAAHFKPSSSSSPVSGSSDVSSPAGVSSISSTGASAELPILSPLPSSAPGPAPGNEAPLGPVLLAVAVACAGSFAFGFNLSVINGPLETIAGDLGIAGNKALMGLVVSSTLAGAALGSLAGGGVADSLGRRMSFLLAAVPMMGGPLLSAVASDITLMTLGRFLTGTAIGLSSALVPTYISEVAPTRIRGTLGTLNQLTICLGILGALLVNVVLPAAQWRAMFTAAALPAVLLGLGMLLGPESPRWLASQHRDAEAAEAARRLWGPQGPAELDTSRTSAAAAAAAAAAVDGSSPGTAVAQPGGLALLRGPAARPLLIGVTLFAFQQFAGINALVYFSSSVFRQAGGCGGCRAGVSSDALASAAVGATNVLGTVIAAGLMDRAGRKQLLANSFLGQAAAMFAMAAGFSLPALQPQAGTIAVVGTLGYILAFALGAGPVPATIVPELNPLSTRGKAVSAAFVSHWVCNVVVGQTFMSAVQSYGLAPVYTFFGIMALAGAFYVRSQVPETKGKTLEQIEAELRGDAKSA
ncbi:hypothetical protein VOLCADRAFT_104700 [Volvox carteri f. nagariensis]|uniref:Major facilitator superfamily (MFS) profile domain-containing protein n=1 Tax=Volvox carteri f. nagariensis TaxID=3068 RepID=D8TV55_VOLCA|nr:uncharacterized protein VOLCADRAFT_104700 [Volvox carteri f. nagariensis]EFJ48518.1 hypothetical protein VOLCADRAFT_104700 [Volvox carteri f. nagariensis]|eukprot:XP_002950317.1 hypothetical protein VOLCADRAFT_104700 [Volvox carteri f. nagariensis]